MQLEPHKIAVLFHESDTETSVSKSVVSILAQRWREDGHHVFYLFGTSQFEPADLVFVHVNLTTVPDSYIEFAHRYPIAVNAQIKDIRKSRYSIARLKAGETYDGPVIVKTDLNYAGKPEFDRLGQVRTHSFNTPMDYKIYSHINKVPAELTSNPELIIERFVPEMDGKFFCARSYNFLGEHEYWLRLRSEHAIVNAATHKHADFVEPDPTMLAVRKQLKMDYGKLDYVMVNGKSLLLDVNKTMGTSQLAADPRFAEQRNLRAQALYAFFDPEKVELIAPWIANAVPVRMKPGN